jgi:hypothetical protein
VFLAITRRLTCLQLHGRPNTLRGYITLWQKERNALRDGSPIKAINSQNSRTSTAYTPQIAPAAVGKSQYHHIVEPQFGPIPNQHYDTETALGAYSSLYDNHLQRPSSNTYTIPSVAQPRSSVEHIDPSVLALKDPDQFVHTEPDRRAPMGRSIASSRQQNLLFMEDAETTLINWPPLNNYDQVSDPSPSEYIQEVEMPDASSPGLTTFEMSTGTSHIVAAS